ncbi:hypothetical protein CWI84_09480 [Idiomarina tyrosinivorans]|uniref:Flagellar assembly protein T N-terminal domain-containing protein n=1 Tax=Idiomarina tyrosinivorans TaxID=1445662 RepID=A0A432ZPM0_9GAMM|nr:flagella assembly protein FlgT [Idiomarina tyrosinivorans]RUO79849.1 hypothetical protein CWI84_09480 [Idiomarina tyrosinivorans]
MRSLVALVIVTLAGLSSLYASPASARWVEAHGSARIINGDFQAARQKAIENALQQALVLSGGNLQSMQKVVDGVLQQPQTAWRSDGDIDQVSIVREQTRGGRVEVTIRADIWLRSKQCKEASYKKSLVVVPFELNDRQQARYGQIWTIGEVSAERFAREMGSTHDSLYVSHTLQQPAGMQQALRQINLEQLGEIARELGRANDSQFVLMGFFDDLSMTQQGTTGWWFWGNTRGQRHFALTLYLLDAYSGEVITRARVEDDQPWTFERNASVDVGADYFWKEPFGMSLQQGLDDLSQGIAAKLRCEDIRGRIVRTDDNSIQINLGRVHGVKPGDTLTVVHEANFIDDQGQFRQKWNITASQVKVTQVTHQTATATLPDDDYLGNIQVNDWVIPASSSGIISPR